MVSLNTLILLAAVSAPHDTELLEFSADWCGHCRTMEPTVRRLEADGYPVRHVNVDRQRPLATQHRVAGIPCYVLLVAGREVGRLEGATSYDRLVQLFRAAPASPPNISDPAVVAPLAPVVRGQSPENKPFGLPALGKLGSMFERKTNDNVTSPTRSDPFAARGANSAASVAPANSNQPLSDIPASVAQAALRATVRLRVDDSKGQSIGTGTIIDTHDDEALIVTCGHIFRDSAGKGPISVDLFIPGAGQPVAGQLVAYDLQRDVGLVSIRAGIPLTSMTVAPAGFPVIRGQRVFTLGCDRGGTPSVLDSRVTAVNKYLGPPNFEVAGQPVDGRSGGGLFSADGHLIGVCNAADPADKEGIYAALATVQWQLDQVGLVQVYQSTSPNALATLDTPASSPGPIASKPLTNVVPPLNNVALRDRSSPTTSSPPPGNSRVDVTSEISDDLAIDAELICIVRPRGNAMGRSEVLILDRVPTELLERLSREARPQRAPEVLDRANSRETDRFNTATPPSRRGSSDRGPSDRSQVIRGQSAE